MDISIVKQQMQQKRQSAKDLLASLFQIPEGFSSGVVENLVDDIISATILEVTIIQYEAQKAHHKENSGERMYCQECGQHDYHHFTCSKY